MTPLLTLAQAADTLRGHVKGPDDMLEHHIDWVIIGGESGPGSRPFCIDWARDIIAQCVGANVPVFMKQLGAKAYEESSSAPYGHRDRKGADVAEWPEELRVRQFPITKESA